MDGLTLIYNDLEEFIEFKEYSSEKFSIDSNQGRVITVYCEQFEGKIPYLFMDVSVLVQIVDRWKVYYRLELPILLMEIIIVHFLLEIQHLYHFQL